MSKKRVSSVRPCRAPTATGRPKNQLLAALPAEDFRRLAPHLKTVALRTKQVLHKRGEPIRQVYFPNGGVVLHHDRALDRHDGGSGDGRG